MAGQDNNKTGWKAAMPNIVGIALTVIAHGVIIVTGFVSGLKYMYPPPEEQAMLIDFTEDTAEIPEQEITSSRPTAEKASPEEEVKLVQASQAQETGTKSDIRWWKQLDMSGNGLQFVSEAPFSASALHYTIDSLDSGWTKQQEHSNEVEEADLTNVLIDKVQMGLGCVNSWGALPDAEYMLPYGDYEFTFIMTPVKHNITIL